MALIDSYIEYLAQHRALEARFESGEHVVFTFPDKELRGAAPLDHRSIVRILQEVAPSDAVERLSRDGDADFTFKAPHGMARARIVAIDRQKWKVTLTVEGDAGMLASQAPRQPPSNPARETQVIPNRPPASSQSVMPAAASVPPPAGSDKTAVLMSNAVSMPEPNAAAQDAAARAAGPPNENAKIFSLLRLLVKRKGSDLHMSTGVVPLMRVHGEMVPADAKFPVLTDSVLRSMLMEVITPKAKSEFDECRDADFAIQIPGVARFRANYFVDRRGIGAVFRQIPFEVIPCEKLGLPATVTDLCNLTKGIVLVTGPTGSGKSTTLASLVDVCNQKRTDHIITIEDPVEFVHENKKCLVNQREVGTHTGSFKAALRAALREDPDIVLVGEMRDLETVAIAIETAETGHLVFGTLHTNTAASTVNRIIDQFPADRQEQIRIMLSESLRAVIAQVLCKKIGGGRIAAYEILIGTPAVAALIREGKTSQMTSVMQTGRSLGMQTLNEHLIQLVSKGLVEPKEAYMKSVDKTGIADAFTKMNLEFR